MLTKDAQPKDTGFKSTPAVAQRAHPARVDASGRARQRAAQPQRSGLPAVCVDGGDPAAVSAVEGSRSHEAGVLELWQGRRADELDRARHPELSRQEPMAVGFHGSVDRNGG